MTSIKIEVEGLDEVLGRMERFPQTLQRETRLTMEDTLYALQDQASKMGYPPQRPTNYVRTFTLGRTLGMEGGKASIFEIRQQGGGTFTEGTFGTNLNYAPYVIGEKEQAWMHEGYWWTINVVAEQAKRKIEQLWQDLRDDLVAFLEGRMA